MTNERSRFEKSRAYAQIPEVKNNEQELGMKHLFSYLELPSNS